MTAGDLGHQVGGRRRDDNQVTVAGEADVPGIELTRGVEQIGVAALMRQRARGQRGDELLGRLGQHHTDIGTAILQPADQVHRLVGRNAAADDQRHPRAARLWLGASAFLRIFRRRN